MFFAWSRDFNPNIQRQTSAQIWLHSFGLAQEYWRPNILFAIVSSVGTSIYTDSTINKSLLDRNVGHFARVLADINLMSELRYKVLVERKGFSFFC